MLLTIKEVAKELKVNTNYVYRLINAGLLPYVKLGSKKVRRETLEKFLEKHDGDNIDYLLETEEKERGVEHGNY